MSAGHVRTQGSAATVVMSRHQPPLMLPPSSPVSSVTYSDQTPFGLVPLNTLSADPPEGGGPGEKVSTPSKFVGLNVPETSVPLSGKLLPAASSNVKVTLLTAMPLPTSDMMIAFCPPGPTSMMSTSSGNVWLKLFKVTVRLVIVPVAGTEMVDGKGVAGPSWLIVIDPVLQN